MPNPNERPLGPAPWLEDLVRKMDEKPVPPAPTAPEAVAPAAPVITPAQPVAPVVEEAPKVVDPLKTDAPVPVPPVVEEIVEPKTEVPMVPEATPTNTPHAPAVATNPAVSTPQSATK